MKGEWTATVEGTKQEELRKTMVSQLSEFKLPHVYKGAVLGGIILSFPST